MATEYPWCRGRRTEPSEETWCWWPFHGGDSSRHAQRWKRDEGTAKARRCSLLSARSNLFFFFNHQQQDTRMSAPLMFTIIFRRQLRSGTIYRSTNRPQNEAARNVSWPGLQRPMLGGTDSCSTHRSSCTWCIDSRVLSAWKVLGRCVWCSSGACQ